MPRAGRLDSWKDIAQYIGRDVSTAIRWERERGLPVHRVPGSKRGSVYALTDEIDRWLGGKHEAASEGTVRPVAGLGRGWRYTAALLALAVATSLALVARSGTSKRPNAAVIGGVELYGTELHALGADGRVLWSHDFGRPVLKQREPLLDGSWKMFASDDLDGDGRPELLVSVTFGDGGAMNAALLQDELFAFAGDGRPLWSLRLEDEVAFGAGRYGPPWRSLGPGGRGRSVAVFEVDGRRRVVWAQAHHTWWPSILTVLDAGGHVISKWVHAGVIYTVVPARLQGEQRLLVGGVSNAREAAFLAVLDARRVTGADPEQEGSPFECLSCDPVRPLRYFTFSPSELALATAPYDHVFDVRVGPAAVEVHTLEAPPQTTFQIQGISDFSPDFVLQHASWSSAWDNRHRELEAEGRIQHAAEQCPNRDGRPRVREWTTAAGWRELTPADADTGTRTARR